MDTTTTNGTLNALNEAITQRPIAVHEDIAIRPNDFGGVDVIAGDRTFRTAADYPNDPDETAAIFTFEGHLMADRIDIVTTNADLAKAITLAAYETWATR